MTATAAPETAQGAEIELVIGDMTDPAAESTTSDASVHCPARSQIRKRNRLAHDT